ncbi:unnamed protein product [Protopolystoma xenopodis]|uniref:Uncharacterized protein n=1 Tax=Protopolystoma xenopodis TaxID=117903 RepID=A0A3S5BIG0_9PLAT|nr:unnamed protein product [Protopolystoma xenopodis]
MAHPGSEASYLFNPRAPLITMPSAGQQVILLPSGLMLPVATCYQSPPPIELQTRPCNHIPPDMEQKLTPLPMPQLLPAGFLPRQLSQVLRSPLSYTQQELTPLPPSSQEQHQRSSSKASELVSPSDASANHYRIERICSQDGQSGKDFGNSVDFNGLVATSKRLPETSIYEGQEDGDVGEVGSGCEGKVVTEIKEVKNGTKYANDKDTSILGGYAEFFTQPSIKVRPLFNYIIKEDRLIGYPRIRRGMPLLKFK